MILKKYPDVLKLMQGTSYISYYLAVAVVLAQLSLAYYLRVNLHLFRLSHGCLGY